MDAQDSQDCIGAKSSRNSEGKCKSGRFQVDSPFLVLDAVESSLDWGRFLG